MDVFVVKCTFFYWSGEAWFGVWLLECNLTKWKWSPLACSMSHSLVLVLWALQVCVVLCHRVQCDAADLAGVAPFQTWNQTHEQIHHVNKTSDTLCFNPLNYQYAPAHAQCPHVNTVYWSISVFCHVACCWEWDDKRHAFPIQAESEASGARASGCLPKTTAGPWVQPQPFTAFETECKFR